MADLNQQISQLLSDPNTLRQLQTMMGSLGLGGEGATPQSAPQNAPQSPAQGDSHPAPPPPSQKQESMPDLSVLAGMLGALGGGGQQGNPLGESAGTLTALAKLGPVLSQANREDDSTRLLRALRPLLSEGRQKKVDEAVKILQLMRMLPLLRDMGGLGLF